MDVTMVRLEFWQIILLLIAFFGCIGGVGRLLLSQFNEQLDQRFEAQEKLRAEAAKGWEGQFAELRKANNVEAAGVANVERELLKLRAELPREYVRREDHIRFETVITAKLDSLGAKLDLNNVYTKRD